MTSKDWVYRVGDGVYLTYKETPETDWYFGVIRSIKNDNIVEVVTDKRTTVLVKTAYLVPTGYSYYFEK